MKEKSLNKIKNLSSKYNYKFPIYCILDNIKNVNNIESIFKTSDSANIHNLLLCENTETPSKKVESTSFEGMNTVDWKYFDKTEKAILSLKKKIPSIQIISVKKCDKSIPYNELKINFPIALVFGNEISGIQNTILNVSDFIIDIPSYRNTNSLNVAVSYGIILYFFINQYLEKELFAKIVFNLPTNRSFTYRIPADLHKDIRIGQRVLCPFGKNKKEKLGYTLSITNEKPPFSCHDILKIQDKNIYLNQNTINLAKWISKFYICSLGKSLSLFLPKETEAKEYIHKEVIKKPLHSLNLEQKNIILQIKPYINERKSETFLIYGITGSGKTEIYKHLCKYVLKKNEKVIILVPEISLTPQMIEEFQSYFGNQLALFHSHLNSKNRYHEWLNVYKDKTNIILGARSALFIPQKKIGLIIIDEEHETSYKSSDHPRYLTKQIAYKMSKDLNIPLVMGSATPNIETYYSGINKRISLLEMKKRHSKYQTKKIDIIDMKKEKSFISVSLYKRIMEKLKKKEQIILFLNRRGYSQVYICKNCGYCSICPNCDISLTYHQNKNILLCHLCSYTRKKSTLCENCKSSELFDLGYGTEKIQEEIGKLFLQAKIARMDLDTTKKRDLMKKF